MAYPKLYNRLLETSGSILTSPLRRTVQTTLLGFPELDNKEQQNNHGRVKLEIWPDLQETQAHPCDVGSSREELEREFGVSVCDFSLCFDGWTNKIGRYAPTNEALDLRALDVRRMLKKRKEKLLVVVCHAGFLRHIVELPHSHIWRNVEARVYRFEQRIGNPLQPDSELALLERIPVEEEREILGGNEDILVHSH